MALPNILEESGIILKLNKEQKNILISSLLVLGTSIFLGTSLVIFQQNKTQMVDIKLKENNDNQNKFTYPGVVLEKDQVIALGWDQKETITLDDWKNQAPNVTAIGDSVFNDGTVNDLSRSPFANNSILTSIQIPPTIQNINYGSFAYATSLISVEFSGTSQLQSIRRSAFEGSGITSINIPNSVKIIDGFAFNKTETLTTIDFANNSTIEIIGEGAFNRSAITSINVPNSVTIIGENAFSNTTSLPGNQVSMLSTLRQNSSSPLYGFTKDQWDTIEWRPIPFTGTILTKEDVINLCWDTKTEITLSDWQTLAPEVTKIGLVDEEIHNSPFASNTILQSIEIPAKITAINYGAFYSTSSLRTITFEENSELFTIGKSAFEGAGITKLILPESVKVVGDSAFKNTNRLAGDKISMPITLSKNLETPLYGFSQAQWDLINWFSPNDSINFYIFIGSLSGALILLLVVNALIILKLKKISKVENNYDKSQNEEDSVEMWEDSVEMWEDSSEIQDDSSEIRDDGSEIQDDSSEIRDDGSEMQEDNVEIWADKYH